MSGFKNLFRKNANIRDEPGNANRRQSSYEDGEDLYEAVDHASEDNSSTFSPYPEEVTVWSEGEFDEEEDIYLNESELQSAGKDEKVEKPDGPPLPPRAKGSPQNQKETSVPALPRRTQAANHQQPPLVSDYKKLKRPVIEENSFESEDYEEFDEMTKDKPKIEEEEEDEDSDSPDYEAIDSPVSKRKPFHKKGHCEQAPAPPVTKGKPIEVKPAPTPPLLSRSRGPCPPAPQENDTGADDEGDEIYEEAEDIPLPSHKNPSAKKPEFPVRGVAPAKSASDNEEIYEPEDQQPIVSNFPRKHSGTAFDSLQSRKFLPTPAIPDQKPKPTLKLSPTPRRNKPLPPEPERQCSYEIGDDSPPPQLPVSKKPKNTSKPSNDLQKVKPVEENPAAKLKHRALPYTHVTPKNKDAEDIPPSSSLGRNALKPNKTEINKPLPEIKQPSLSKAAPFLQKNKTADNSSAEDAEEERTTKENNKPIRNNYWKHTPPKMPTQDNTNASGKPPAKTNYPLHFPLKFPIQKFGQNQDEVPSANEENSILADARNKLKAFESTLVKEDDGNRTGEKRFQGITTKQPIKGYAPPSDSVSPYSKEQRGKNFSTIPDSKNQKERGNKTPPSEKVLPKSKSHISELMNKLEKQVSLTNSGSKHESKNSPVVAQKNQSPLNGFSGEKNVAGKFFKDKNGYESDSSLQKCKMKCHSDEKLVKEEAIKQSIASETKPCKSNLKHSNTHPKPSKSPIVPCKPKMETPRKDPLEDCSWYLPEVSRNDAEKKLRSIGKDGTFLIRNSQKGASLTPYSLSLLHLDKIYNLQIRKRGDNRFAIGSEKAEEQSFADLAEMVSYHGTNPLIMDKGIKIYFLHPAGR